MYFGFKNISIHYGKTVILRDVTIDFPQGKTTTIIGPNGSGKSSLLRTISRAVSPASGTVIYQAKPLQHYKARYLAKKIAYLPQFHHSPEDIDVKTLVSYGRYPYSKFGRGMTSQDRLILEESLEMVGLRPMADRLLHSLSGGERQRAWIGMTLCQKPEILVLDEPITHLDIGYQIEVMELIKSLGQRLDITILMVLHDINLAARYSDYLLTLKDQGVLAFGKPREIINQENVKKIFHIDAQIIEDTQNNCPFMIPERL